MRNKEAIQKNKLGKQKIPFVKGHVALVTFHVSTDNSQTLQLID